MSAIVTDQFRILNTDNFVQSVENTSNSYYIFVGLPNPTDPGFGRDSNWNTNVPDPIDNIDYDSHALNTVLFAKKITSSNITRVIRRIDWTRGTKYEMYRHDYSIKNPSPITSSSRLYDANYYVMNSNYKVYICIDNGSLGINTTGNSSQDEPNFTDLEPSKAGESGDGYVWKYLFTVNPSDIIKFDSTEYITVPNNWQTSTDPQIEAIRENGDSTVNENQIKKVYIDKQGNGYANILGKELNILGDGSGAKVTVDVVNNKITNTQVSAGGKGYTFGIVDLSELNSGAASANGSFARLIPIIPPSKGHGYNIYKELGTDRVLLYARFDDSNKDFPIDTKFAQIGILKNPTISGSATSIFTENQFTSASSIKFSTVTGNPVVGEKISQPVLNNTFTAFGYVVSYDKETKVLKYIQDRSLYYNQTTNDQTDYVGVSTYSRVLNFESTANEIRGLTSNFTGSVAIGFTGMSLNTTGNKVVNLGVNFTGGLAGPEINTNSGEIIYLDNRPLISRSTRQKEDIKIILEF